MAGPVLQVNLQVVIASNTGTIRFGPYGEAWNIKRIAVKTTTHVLESTCQIYRGQIGDLYLSDITYTGSTGDTSYTDIDLVDGENMYAVWTGADNGATATITITGTRSEPDGGFRAVSK